MLVRHQPLHLRTIIPDVDCNVYISSRPEMRKLSLAHAQHSAPHAEAGQHLLQQLRRVPASLVKHVRCPAEVEKWNGWLTVADTTTKNLAASSYELDDISNGHAIQQAAEPVTGRGQGAPVLRLAIGEHNLEGAVLQPKAVERQENGQQLHPAPETVWVSSSLW